MYDCLSGEWVTVMSAKDKKSKQAQQTPEQPASKPAPTEEPATKPQAVTEAPKVPL